VRHHEFFELATASSPRSAALQAGRGEFDILSIYRQHSPSLSKSISRHSLHASVANRRPCDIGARRAPTGTRFDLSHAGEENAMSQTNVERVIGQLVTDEAFRRRFAHDPSAALHELAQNGMQLNPCEVEALLGLDLRALARCANAIDPRLQKSDLRGRIR
jgi:hypothetical protein